MSYRRVILTQLFVVLLLILTPTLLAGRLVIEEQRYFPTEWSSSVVRNEDGQTIFVSHPTEFEKVNLGTRMSPTNVTVFRSGPTRTTITYTIEDENGKKKEVKLGEIFRYRGRRVRVVLKDGDLKLQDVTSKWDGAKWQSAAPEKEID